MAQEQWLRKTINLAHKHVGYYQGEPFAAIVVQGGSIVGQGTDLVAERKDPTAHAEIEAIREACQVLGTTDLSGCILYTSAHPCPMCLAAAYWAGIEAVYFVYSLEELAASGLGAGGWSRSEPGAGRASARRGSAATVRRIASTAASRLTSPTMMAWIGPCASTGA